MSLGIRQIDHSHITLLTIQMVISRVGLSNSIAWITQAEGGGFDTAPKMLPLVLKTSGDAPRKP